MSRQGRVVLIAVVMLALGGLLPETPDAATQERALRSSGFDWNDVKAEATKVGAVRRFFRLPTSTVGELECHVTTLNPGESPHPPHRHPEEEIIIVRDGNVESFLEGQTRRLGPGSVIFQASNELHGIRNVGEGPATYHVFKWSGPPVEKTKP